MIEFQKKSVLVALGIFLVAAALAIAAVTAPFDSGDDTPMLPDPASLKWQASDEFKGLSGQPPDPAMWDYDLGGGGWGNGEKQTYTDRADNARLDGKGYLVIQAHRTDEDLTSARIVTRGKFDFTEGLLQARIKFPSGSGIHPAFWLLGSNIASAGYPDCGEIDVMEIVGSGGRYHTAIHGPWASNTGNFGPKWKQSSDGPFPVDLSEDYHVYGVYREPGRIAIGIDGRIVGDYKREDMPDNAKWVFDTPMYVTLNIAVGGEWPGPPAADTRFPATMSVDWIRYYK